MNGKTSDGGGYNCFSQLGVLLYHEVHENLMQHPSNNKSNAVVINFVIIVE